MISPSNIFFAHVNNRYVVVIDPNQPLKYFKYQEQDPFLKDIYALGMIIFWMIKIYVDRKRPEFYDVSYI